MQCTTDFLDNKVKNEYGEDAEERDVLEKDEKTKWHRYRRWIASFEEAKN